MQRVVIDQPYQFIPPKLNRFWHWTARKLLPGRLRRDYGVTRVECIGAEKLKASLDGLISFIARLLQEAKDQGHLSARLEPEATARFIISAWQGSLIRMKAVAGPEPLDTFQAMTFEVLLA